MLGGLFVFQGNAATYVAKSEAESASLTGQVGVVSATAASAGSALRFGADLKPPAGLVAFTGGSSIALRWEPSVMGDSPVTAYEIYRDGAKVATINPSVRDPLFPEKNNCGYLDKSVVAGRTYAYQVRAVDGAGKVSALTGALNVTQPTSTQPTPTFSVDTTQASDLDGYVRNTVIPFLQVWYPKVADKVAYPNYTARTAISIKLSAATAGNACLANYGTGSITCNPTYIRTYPQDIGAWLHESTHLMGGSTALTFPDWLAEGISDYAREYILHDRDPVGPIPNDGTYMKGYSQASFFLNWIQTTYDSGLIKKLMFAVRNGTYSDSLFTQYTGKTLAQLYSQMTPLFFGNNGYVTGVGGKCVSTAGNATVDSTPAQINPCSALTKWQAAFMYTGKDYTKDFALTMNGGAPNQCLKAKLYGTADDTPVYSFTCNDLSAQRWRRGAQNTLLNVHANKCLDTLGKGTVNGTELVIRTCDGSPTQQWTLP